jgi:DNA-binding NarL/FixJ family response regulator
LQASRKALGIVPPAKPKPPAVRNPNRMTKARREELHQIRKRATLALCAQGVTVDQIASQLDISVSTVKRYIFMGGV